MLTTNESAAMTERAAMQSARIASLGAARRQRLELGAAVVERISGAGRWAGGDETRCRLLFQAASFVTLLADENGTAVELTEGNWTVQPPRPLHIEGERGGELISVEFPAALLSRSLAAHLHSAPSAAAIIRGASHMCLELARSCLAQGGAVSPAVAETLGESLVELAKLAIIEESGAKRGETMRETARARIQGFIHRNLSDPDLSIERIADRMQCTKRYLHKVFSREGETLNQYIWSQRLELCRLRLSRRDLSDKSITEIAFACGFSNAAHFSRSFRARFGEAPRAYRRAALNS